MHCILGAALGGTTSSTKVYPTLVTLPAVLYPVLYGAVFTPYCYTRVLILYEATRHRLGRRGSEVEKNEIPPDCIGHLHGKGTAPLKKVPVNRFLNME